MAPTIKCVNNRITIKENLKIDFDNLQSIMHLRIPKRNKRPEDVVLASGYKSKWAEFYDYSLCIFRVKPCEID